MSTILNTPALKPASLGGNTWQYESRGGSRRRKRRTNKRSQRNNKQTKTKSKQ